MRRLLIANRGEIAIRVARTARTMGIDTVAVYSEADRGSPHVDACDEAVLLGGERPSESYLAIDKIVAAAQRVGADAIHPGYGFLSESAPFASAVTAAGITWVGPSPEVIESMGDKLAAKRVMSAAGVPILPSAELDHGSDAIAAARDVGYPLLVKAAAGGGGKGMRFIASADELVDAVDACRREAAAAFGDDRVFLERFMVSPRHVEVQVLGDSHGNVIHLFERECSIQRRHQKIIEETPSPALADDVREHLCATAVTAARAIKYENAGTVEFVLGADGSFAFLEVNTRLQVEHPITEAITGLDLVRLQLLVADGHPLPITQADVVRSGHAIEARLYAEDPTNDYLPAPGVARHFVAGCDDFVRWDAGIRSGTAVTSFYDPLLAKVIAHASSREAAAASLAKALRETHLQGVTTNRDLLVEILGDEDFLSGATTTDFLDRRFPTNERRTFLPSAEARRTAAIVATLAGERARRGDSTLPSGWRNSRSQDQTVQFAGAEPVEVAYRAGRGDHWTFTVDGDAVRVRSVPTTIPPRVVVEIDGHRVTAHVSEMTDHDRTVWEVTTARGHVGLDELPRFPARVVAEIPGACKAPMPGSVLRVDVAVGAHVERGDLLCIVEAMKMEHRITAPYEGTVTEVHVVGDQQVDADQVLVVIEAMEGSSA